VSGSEQVPQSDRNRRELLSTTQVALPKFGFVDGGGGMKPPVQSRLSFV
jgi:hypothetical protein